MAREYDHLFKLLIIGDSGKACLLSPPQELMLIVAIKCQALVIMACEESPEHFTQAYSVCVCVCVCVFV